MAPPIIPVNIAGLAPALPHYFQRTFRGIDFHSGDDANGHHEGRVVAVRRENPNRDNKYVISGWQTKTGYQVDIYFNDTLFEPIGIFNNGRVILDFDQATRRWSMKGYVPGPGARREWAFCAPEAMVDHVVAALDAFRSSPVASGIDGLLPPLIESIKASSPQIAASATRYENAKDCEAPGRDLTAVYDTY